VDLWKNVDSPITGELSRSNHEICRAELSLCPPTVHHCLSLD
jgi:hypothetical protein